MKTKKAVITGGSMGIGAAIAMCLIEAGVQVYSLDKSECQNEGLKRHDKFKHIPCNLGSFDDLKAAIKTLKDELDTVDYLINNAALQYETTFEKFEEPMWDEVMNVNLKAPFFLIQGLLKQMKSGARVLNISSVHGAYPRINKYSYDASKAGLNMLTQSLALELAEHNIKVNALAIGATKTPMNQMFHQKEHLIQATKKIPLKRVSEPEEIAQFVMMLLDDKNAYMTGSIVYFDGGRHLF